MKVDQAKYPGIPCVIHGNGAVAHVMNHVCGGVIGYPITPSTEIAELFEAARADGSVNVWGKHPFFFSPEGEHSAQSGALGAALTGGQYISNASSSQGILYAMESHYVTVGKKVGGFVLQVAARVVSRHSLNVMAGHDDVYALLSAGYTILFGANPQEAADLAAISYRLSADSLIPVANAMDGFSTSHMLSEACLPEPELLAEFIGDPQAYIKAPTLAQEMLFGAKGRVAQLRQYLDNQRADLTDAQYAALDTYLNQHAEAIEQDAEGKLLDDTLAWLPAELQRPWRRQWRNAHAKGTRQRVPALVDINNPGLTGPVQNQPDFQAGAIDHRTHFVSAVPAMVRQAMAEYSALTGRHYAPIHTFHCDDAETVMVGLGSVTEDVEAVVSHLRAKGEKVGLVAVKLLQPFPEAEIVAALKGKKAVMVLERSEQTALSSLVTQALFKARENADQLRYEGIDAIEQLPMLTTAIFGLGGHDLQPRHLIAAFHHLASGNPAPLVYLGSQFFSKDPSPRMAELQARLKAAYPETERMALETGDNPRLLPDSAFRIRFHSVGGYGTIASGKLLTDILAGALDLHSKAAPKYGSEKSGAPTNYYITLSPEPIKITNAELEDVEIVISPDHKVFSHTNPLRGLARGGTFILQSNASPEEIWRELPQAARQTIRDKQIRFLVIDAFSVASKHSPSPALATRMMGIAFIGAVAGHVPQVLAGTEREVLLDKIAKQIAKKFGSKGEAIVEGNMNVIRDGIAATLPLDYDSAALRAIDGEPAKVSFAGPELSAAMCRRAGSAATGGLFDKEYFEEMVAKPFRSGTIGEAPVLPGIGMFMPTGTAGAKDKGLFRRTVPDFDPAQCTGCMECTMVCPDAAMPSAVHDIHELLRGAIGQLELTGAQRETMHNQVFALVEAIRAAYRDHQAERPFHEHVEAAVATLGELSPALRSHYQQMVAKLADYPVARTKPFFDAMEKAQPGTGGLFNVSIDPWKCSGCLECVDVCGPGALKARDQDNALFDTLQRRFAFLAKLPSTPERFVNEALEQGGDIKRLMLVRDNYYATTGGHGGCRGCGEVTAIRLVMSTSQAITEKRRRLHTRQLEQIIAALEDKRDALPAGDQTRERLSQLSAKLENQLYQMESGPTGNGQSGTVIANATGCSSVYASTFPFNPYNDPWVNSLFQDAQPLAKGMFEGIAAQKTELVRALRQAQLELAGEYRAEEHDSVLRYLNWSTFTPEELKLLPTVMTIGGDGANYDIGFGALSRILVSGTPIKIMVLNTGAYSNTGGQASTSSYVAQDSDLARFGKAHHGKHEQRKELALIAAFHGNVFACVSSTALHGHFLKNTLAYLEYTDGPAMLDVYTPCQGEHGIADRASAEHSRLAVESRMCPVFVHDPRRGKTLFERLSLEGNPDLDKTWSKTTLEYLDAEGKLQLMEVALTPAQFALGENRFKKQFSKLDDSADAVPVDAYVELNPEARDGKTPFIYAVDGKRRLTRLAVSDEIVALTEDRRRNWQLLQTLSGRQVAVMNENHRAELEALKQQYLQAVEQRESSIDAMARTMADLATASKAPASIGQIPIVAVGGQPAAAASAAAPAAAGDALLVFDDNDHTKCTSCNTCYQELPELFEKTRVVVEGESRDVAQLIPGALDKVTVTDELKSRVARVIANCDAEVIR
ncbi:2-oxoacid:acceptor oxidoreductase family protein [Paludibacterium sp. THUN1379]|uniref:2-oxoacid:acceptor oxidoreductase family protein n=1 Tax=Paludibacterium sp. THUN1379 TaxID=3112107 RepID=UPI0030CAEC2F